MIRRHYDQIGPGESAASTATDIVPSPNEPQYSVPSCVESVSLPNQLVPRLFRVSEQHSISQCTTCIKAVPRYLEVSLGRFYSLDFTFPPKNLVSTPKTYPSVGGYKMGKFFALRAKTSRRCST
jgi:hypothetical protein